IGKSVSNKAGHCPSTNIGIAKITKLVQGFKVPIPAILHTVETHPHRMPRFILHTLSIHSVFSIKPKVIEISAATAKHPGTVQSPDGLVTATRVVEYSFFHINWLQIKCPPLRGTESAIPTQPVVGAADIGSVPGAHKPRGP